MRSFEFAMKNGEQAYINAQLPEYQTTKAAGADFFCAETVTIPSIWKLIPKYIKAITTGPFAFIESDLSSEKTAITPTLIHTGIKANMEEDEVLELYNRSSNPKKLGLILSNGVGVIDADYYGNPDNDGEIMFAFYNIMPYDITINAGTRIGQGVFKKFLRPEKGLRIKTAERMGGFGSTNNK